MQTVRFYGLHAEDESIIMSLHTRAPGSRIGERVERVRTFTDVAEAMADVQKRNRALVG